MFTRNARLALVINALLSFSNSVSMVFVNMYLYRFLGDLAALTVFNLFQFALMPLGFYLAGHMARRTGTKWPLASGLLLFVAFYALLVLLRERSANCLYLLGTISGLANGMFWYAFNILVTDVTDDATRPRFFGMQGALNGATSVLAPMISTLFLVGSPSEEIGYVYLFLSIMAITGLMLAATFALRVPDYRAAFTVRDKLLPGRDRAWNFALTVNLVYGIRDGANWTIFSILVLKAVGNDIAAGSLNILFAAVAAATNYLGGRFLTPRTEKPYWGWAALGGLVSAILLVVVPTPAMAGFSGVLWKVAEAMICLPINTVFFGIMARYKIPENGIAGRNIAAETSLNLGRAIGAGSFLVLSCFTSRYAEIAFPLVTLALPASFLVYTRYRRTEVARVEDR